MAVYKRGGTYWFRFVWNGETIRESAKTGNKRTAEQIEAARKTQMAKGEVGIRDRTPVPTFANFAKLEFVPYVETRFAEKPGTRAHYTVQMKHLLAYTPFAGAQLDSIKGEAVSGFIEKLRMGGYQVSSINRSLQVLRRVLMLAAEWGRIDRVPVKIQMQPGENKRERTLSDDEVTAYLKAAVEVGDTIAEAYEKALQGIRAKQRGEEPQKPQDPYLLHDVAVILLDCGLRPEECHRLRWEHHRGDTIYVPHGKTVNARREIPLSERAREVLDRRRGGESEWVFPASTASGHIEQSSLKKQHAKACTLAKVTAFVPYTFRHTCLTRWAGILDPYTLAYLAGHRDFATTRRYVHPNLNTAREALERARVAQGGHKFGHTQEMAVSEKTEALLAIA